MRIDEKRGQTECKPMIAAATTALYRQNAFRITGLAVDATPREITKHADKLKLMAELGHDKVTDSAAFALKPPPGVDEIREAIQRLKDPERRIIDEFFWFWPDEFGKGQSDPALQAIARGDSKAAFESWLRREGEPDGSLVARHNLAVLFHLRALDCERHSLQSRATVEEREVLEKSWRSAFAYWERLAEDDSLWEKVNERIRQLDDARLTTGFARRMRASLPEALDKINAELALNYAEAGNNDLARLHIKFMHETNQGLDDVEKTSDLVLNPAKTRLRQHILQAKRASEGNPGAADKTARNLIQSAKPLLELFDLFHGNNNHTRNDLFDEVAEACVSCAIDHQRESHDNQTFVSLLEQALTLAVAIELRQRIEKNIGIGTGNLAFKKLEPIYEALRVIEESDEHPKGKLVRLRQEIMPHLAGVTRTEGGSSNLTRQLSDSIASALRGISIAAHNEHGDTETALDAITSAHDLAHEPDLKRRLLEDKSQISRIRQEQEQHNLLLEIRNDAVEVTRERFRYNSTLLPSTDINGVRFGVFVQYTNGAKSSVSYLVAVSSSSCGAVEIECKRWFRGEDLAKSDFNAIVNSLYHQIIPELCTRLAKSILAGTEIPLGDCWLTEKGIRLPTGVLFWKEEHLLPWSDVRFGFNQGNLDINSAKNPKVSKSLSLRAVWNAVIFKELANKVVTLLDKQRQK